MVRVRPEQVVSPPRAAIAHLAGEGGGCAGEGAASRDVVWTPFTVLRDTQERTGGWRFPAMPGSTETKGREIAVRSVERHLKTGDYTIDGFEDLLAIERKTLSDAYGSVSGGRERFFREHERMADMVSRGGFACVIVEASLDEALTQPPPRSGFSPDSFNGTRISWQLRFGQSIPWLFEGSRRQAEVTAFRLMVFFLEKRIGEKIKW